MGSAPASAWRKQHLRTLPHQHEDLSCSGFCGASHSALVPCIWKDQVRDEAFLHLRRVQHGPCGQAACQASYHHTVREDKAVKIRAGGAGKEEVVALVTEEHVDMGQFVNIDFDPNHMFEESEGVSHNGGVVLVDFASV